MIVESNEPGHCITIKIFCTNVYMEPTRCLRGWNVTPKIFQGVAHFHDLSKTTKMAEDRTHQFPTLNTGITHHFPTTRYFMSVASLILLNDMTAPDQTNNELISRK